MSIGIYTSAIIRKDGKFLLTRHVHIGEPIWLMPGGKPEEGEPAEDCLKRELREELGIIVTSIELHGCYLTKYPDREWIGIFFQVEYSGEPVIKEPAKHSHMAWMTYDELLQVVCGQAEAGITKLLSQSNLRPTSCRINIIGHARTIKTAVAVVEFLRSRKLSPCYAPDQIQYRFKEPNASNGFWSSDIVVQTQGHLPLDVSSHLCDLCRAFVAGAGEVW